MTDPTQRQKQIRAALAVVVFTAGTARSAGETTRPAAEGTPSAESSEPQAKQESSAAEVAEGQRIFASRRSVTNSSGTGKLRLPEVVETRDPTTALKVGLKVDADVLQ